MPPDDCGPAGHSALEWTWPNQFRLPSPGYDATAIRRVYADAKEMPICCTTAARTGVPSGGFDRVLMGMGGVYRTVRFPHGSHPGPARARRQPAARRAARQDRRRQRAAPLRAGRNRQAPALDPGGELRGAHRGAVRQLHEYQGEVGRLGRERHRFGAERGALPGDGGPDAAGVRPAPNGPGPGGACSGARPAAEAAAEPRGRQRSRSLGRGAGG